MCSRFETTDRENAVTRWGINPRSNLIGAAKWGTIFPKYETLLITYDNEPIIRSWGLTPDWAQRPIINAKSEEAHEKKTFVPLLSNRCVIPAESYYEWQGEKGSKIKTKIYGRSIFLIAGLYTAEQYVMFTCPAAEAVAHIHNRMPVILGNGEVSDWLDPGKGFANVKTLLHPFSGSLEWKEIA